MATPRNEPTITIEELKEKLSLDHSLEIINQALEGFNKNVFGVIDEIEVKRDVHLISKKIKLDNIYKNISETNPELLTLLDNVRTDSFSFLEGMSNFHDVAKIKLALDLRQYCDNDKEGYLLYFDSGLDIELPLISGAKRIIMCDVIFNYSDEILYLKEKLSKYGKYYEKGGKIYIDIDGMGEIEIIILPYNESNYSYNEKIYSLISYAKHPMDNELFELPGIKENLVSDFYFYDDRSFIEREPLGLKKLGESNVYQSTKIDLVKSYVTKKDFTLDDIIFDLNNFDEN